MRPQGRRGELLAELLTDLDPAVQFAAGREVMLAGPDTAGLASATGETRPARIEHFFLPTGRNTGRIVLKLDAADSISEAERIAGLQLLVPAAELPSLADDTFYVGDLIGCTLWDAGPAPAGMRDSEAPIAVGAMLPEGATRVGLVVDVEFAMSPDGRTRLDDAAPLLAVRRSSMPESDTSQTEPVLIPFVRAYLQAVDPAKKSIVMSLPDGLLDAEVKGE